MLGGWVATSGAFVIFAPIVAGLLVVPGTPVWSVPARVPATVARTIERRELVTERPQRILPAFGRKGGERAETDDVQCQ